MTYQSLNPADGILLKSYPVLAAPQLEESIIRAHAAFPFWRDLGYARRAAILAKASELMHAHVDGFARLATLEMGKRIEEARAEVRYSADILAYYARHAEKFLEPRHLRPRIGEAHMESSPLGVLFCIEPWNFPYYQLARVAGPQLMAGNTLLVKHAANVPQVALAFEKLFMDAGAPRGAYTNLMISHQQSDAVIDDPRIRGVCLTGSEEAGRSVAARAGRGLKKVTLELGGADAFIVLEDADLERAIPWAVWGRMFNAGQTCCAAKRFIVLDAVADRFLLGFQAALGALQAGDPMDDATTLGPLSSEEALVRLLAQVDEAVRHGATVLMGGKRIDRPGAFMQPTLLTGVDRNNPAFRAELFGPVAMFFRVGSDAEAIALANDSDFGLGGCVFTRDLARGRHVASSVETGMMFINNIDWSDAELPFGGIRNSGFGRELGAMGIQEFVNWKLVRTAHHHAPA